MQRVQVGKYTYETDLPVQVGDTVLLPTADWLKADLGPTHEGTITSLTSDYDGECVKILDLLGRED